MEQGINSPLTSSCGRLFDAVAALAGIRHRVNYEAQAAIELEMAIGNSCDQSAYPFELIPEGEGWVIDTRGLFEALLHDLSRDVPIADISRRFHNGLVEVLAELANRLRERSGLERVCLCGGTFQNVYLCERLCDRLAIVDHGQIIAEGSPADLIERLGGHHVVEFAVEANLGGQSDGAELGAWRALPSVESVREDDGMMALSVKEPHLTIPALLEAVGKQGSKLQRLTTRQASLEDVFVRLTGRHLREE